MMLWVCLGMLVSAAAAAKVKDMSGKMFTFPEEGKTAHVKLNTAYTKKFNAFTVCHRSFTELTRDHSLFSLATRAKQNEVLTFYDSRKKTLAPHIHDARVDYGGLDYAPNKWHSICTTWNSKTGLVQLWFNGMPLTKKPIASSIDSNPIIILGQEQDAYGRNFDAKQSFVGMITDVHMWDYEISPCEIQRYGDELSITPGNVINWAALDFDQNGKVFEEKKQVTCDSACIL